MKRDKKLTKQQLAQKRNYFKYVIMGLYKPVDTSILTDLELDLWNKILLHRSTLLSIFDNASKDKGLKVPEKCWCRKPAKYSPIGYPDYFINEFPHVKVCKEHVYYDEKR